MPMRRQFSPEFKAKVVLEVVSGRKSAAEVCREYQLKPTLFANWKKSFLASAPKLFGREQLVDPAEARIHRLDHRVDRRDGVVVLPLSPFAVFLNQRRRCLKRHVWRMVGEEDREWPIVMPLDESDRLVVQRIRKISAIGLLGSSVAHQVPPPVILRAVGESVKQVEAAVVREIVIAIEAAVPFADQRRRITGMPEVIAKRFFRPIDSIDSAIAGNVDRARAMVVAAGQQRGAGGRAEW